MRQNSHPRDRQTDSHATGTMIDASIQFNAIYLKKQRAKGQLQVASYNMYKIMHWKRHFAIYIKFLYNTIKDNRRN